MRDLNLMFGVGCAVLAFGIVDALSSADLPLAGVEAFFLLCFLVWWMVARHRERRYLDEHGLE